MSARTITLLAVLCAIAAPPALAQSQCVDAYFKDRAELQLPGALEPSLAGDLPGLAGSGHASAQLASRLLASNLHARLVPSFPIPLVQGNSQFKQTAKRFYTVLFSLPSGQTVKDVIQQHLKGPGVDRVAPVPKPRASADSFVGSSRVIEFDNVTKPCGTQWYLHASTVDKAWSCATGTGVNIAIVDWGFYTGHDELKGQLTMSKAYNACDNSNTLKTGPYDRHGTGTTGLVAARAKDDGLQGVAYNAKLWPMQAACSTLTSKPCDDVKWPDWNPWAAAILKAALTDGPPRVLLLETQTCCKGSYEASIAVQGAILVADASKVLVVLPAGNDGRDAATDDDGNPITPTAAIVVGATDYDDELLEKSNYGTRVDVSAPGDLDNDLTLALDTDTCGPIGDEIKGYTSYFGLTSGAAAKVAGVVALMVQRKPGLTAVQAKDYLKRGPKKAENKPLGREAGVVLDAQAALKAADPDGCP